LQDFEYNAAQSVTEVVSLLAQNGKQARILSGGTDLLVQLREGRKKADLVIDIKRVPEANQLVYDPLNGLVMGAAVPCYRFCLEPEMTSAYPGLADAIGLIGGMQIQGRASVGGNLCNASPAADTIPALIVHKAICQIAGPHGMREMLVEQFCVAPGKNALGPGEFLVALRIPPIPAGFGASYIRFIPRNEMDIAVVGAGAAVTLDEAQQKFAAARVALGAVAPIPLFVQEAGEFLVGKEITAENIFEAARMTQAAARPISDMRGTAEQRKHLAFVLTRRALNMAVERAKKEIRKQ
jgi:CO/xanthine dehydrogenase FAD-binding subunit